MRLSCRAFDLKLQDPFTISRGTVSIQSTLIVRVEYGELVGYGEATTNPYYGITLETLRTALDAVVPRVKNYELQNPAELWAELDAQLSQCRFAQCALDCAVWDIYAQMHNLPLWKLWGFRADAACPPTCFTIGIDSPDVMLRKMRSMPDWPAYKIKLPAEGGLDLVRSLREQSSATFRVDANCGWTAADVPARASELHELGVELIEQPLPAAEYAAMAALKGTCPLPLMADESCQEESDIDRCIDSFDAVNIKLVKCGGITPARRMIARAKQNGLQVMVGCMTESSIGIAPGVHLLPLLDFADLDGALLLQSDLAAGLDWEKGYCRLPTAAGLGLELLPECATAFESAAPT